MPHIHDKIDFTIDVFIVYNNTVLLRRHDKYNLWLAIGGHIELDENPNQAAVREAKEEVGLDITLDKSLTGTQFNSSEYKELIPPYFMNIHKINDTHDHLSLIYFATSKSNKISEPETHERSNGCKWYTKEELEQNTEISESIKYYALKALEVLKND